jgi:hypothetical protein
MVAQLALDLVELVAVVELVPAGIRCRRVLVGLVGDERRCGDALGIDLLADHLQGWTLPSCGWPPVMATASL